MARLSFIEQERIARNMTDADILGEYEQKGSVLPPGITMDQSVLLGEMEGRTYVRDATSAAETAANMQPGSTADQQVEKFKGGMEGVQQLLAMGPQQGMGPQGMPQQMGPQMAADGGIIGYSNGGTTRGPYGPVIDDPTYSGRQMARAGMEREDALRYLQGGLAEEKSGIPYLSGATDFLFGARTLQDALDNPLRTLGTTGFTLGAGALTALTGGALAPAFAARTGLVKGIPSLFKALRAPTGAVLSRGGPGGQRLLEMSAAGGLRGRLAGALGGGRYRQLIANNPSLLNMGPGGPFLQTAAQSLRASNFMTPATQAALDRARRVAMLRGGAAIGGAGAYGGSVILSALQEDPTLTQEQVNEAMAAYEAYEAAKKEAEGLGGGGGGALAADLGKMYSDQIRDQVRQQTWLQTATDDEKRFEAALASRSRDLLDRIDPERDRDELLYKMAGGAARAIEQGGTGGSSVEALIDLSDEVNRRGREQRAERQGLEDLAFNFSTIPMEREAARSRQSTFDLTNQTKENYRNQLATLLAQQMQTQGTLAAYQARNQLGIGDLNELRTALQMLGGDNMSPEQIEEAMASAIGIASAPYGIAGLNQ